ncbi:MAG: hypothetical protein WC893_02670 [Candidatus Paceibacterota bacterium]
MLNKLNFRNEIIAVWKSLGQTPLQAINCLRKPESIYANLKIGYAGRLDPLAEGVLLLMVGEANKNRNQYLGLGKKYEAEVLFGVSTDSHDILGKIENVLDLLPKVGSLKEVLSNFEGDFIQDYPAFSSPLLAGHKNFSKQVRINKIECLAVRKITGFQLEKEVIYLINKVKGNFRQSEILAGWKKYFFLRQRQIFIIVKIRVDCSAGVYIRLLAHNWGKEASCPACLFKLKRLSVGNYGFKDCLEL